MKLPTIETNKDKTLSKMRIKVILLNVINLILVAILIFLINTIPTQAEKVKELRSQAASHSKDDKGILESELANNKENVEKIESVFVDEERFVSFISSVDSLRARGLITDFNLPVSNPVPDPSKNLGLPVSLTFAGNITQINEGLTEVTKLPYLLKPVNVNIAISPDGVITLDLGAFLYTHESFNKSR